MQRSDGAAGLPRQRPPCSAGCGRRACGSGDSESAPLDLSQIDVQALDFGRETGTAQKVVILTPRWGAPNERFPLLIALHGRGESNRGLEVGAWAWAKDYWLDRTMVRIRELPLDADALQYLADRRELDRLNGALAKRAFQGLVVACPYTPDILGSDDLDAGEPFAAFLKKHLIPTVRRRFPVIALPEATGIDGVSLGGRMALLAGFGYSRSYLAASAACRQQFESGKSVR